jgi:peptide/nickel transport system substrate-binding protein
VIVVERANANNLKSAPLTRRVLSRRELLKLGGIGVGGALLLGPVGCGVLTEDEGAQQILTAAYNRPIEDLDPHGVAAAAEYQRLASVQIYNTPVVRLGDEIRPSIATEWETPDPTTWVFTLREGVTFHDGSPLTAEDFKASLERQAASEESPLAPLWTALDTVEATDERTVTIRTTEPLGIMLPNLSVMPILPADKVEQGGFFRNPIGSGPFRVESFVPAERLNLAAYPDYWGEGPKLQQLTLRTIQEESTQLTSLETDEVQVTWPIAPDQIERLEGNQELEILDVPSYEYWFNWFNCSREPFTDPNVRRAMWHAIDAQAIVDDLFPGTAEVLKAPIASEVFGYAAQEPYEYDPDRARQLLADAGHADGFSTSLMWARASATQIRPVAETLISYWDEIGVRVAAEELEEAQWLERLLALDWDMDLQTNFTATGDADYTLGRLYISDAERLGYKNPELDEVLLAARRTTDQGERKDLYAQACEIIWNDAPGIFPLETRATYGLRQSVSGFKPAPDDAPSFRTVSLEAQ